jgi:pimeloyl-ACP methyl ester carboxylesterase
MATLTADGARIAYDVTGAGATVIWVHGGFTDRRGFDAVVPRLAGHHRVIAYDRRGHGESERCPGRQRVDDHVGDLAALIRHLDAAPAHLVANSDGGEVALKLALATPDLVGRLVLHEPALHHLLDDDPALAAALADFEARLDAVVDELRHGRAEPAARLVVDTVAFGPGAWATLPEPTRRTMTANGPAWFDTATDPTYGRVAVSRLRSLARPTLVSAGGDGSDPVDVAVVDRLAALVPHARRHVRADWGHVPHRTDPAGFGDLVRGFLDEAPTPG